MIKTDIILPKNPETKMHRLKWSMLPVLLVLVTYISSLGYGFVSDDRAFLVNNPNLTLQPVSAYFQHGVWQFSNIDISDEQLYRPMALLNYRLQSELWGNNPTGFHLTNIMGHLIVTILVFNLLLLLIPLASGKSLALATSIFALHPANTEVVSWILANADIWAAVWLFISVFLLFRIKESNSAYLIVIGLGLVFVAMLTKEVAYTFPGLITVLFLIRKNYYSYKHTIIITLLACIPVVLAIILRGNAVDSANLIFDFAGIEKAVIYFLGYLKMTVFPFPYRFYLIDPTIGMVSIWELSIGIVVLVGFCILIWRRKEGRRFFILSGAWYFMTLVPALAISFHVGRATFAARMLYLSVFSISMIVLWLLTNGSKKGKQLVTYSVVVIIALFMSLSLWTKSNWQNEGSFLKMAINSTPNNVDLYVSLGDYYSEIGETSNAVETYKTLLLKTNLKDTTKILAHERLGEIYAMNKFYSKAIHEFEEVLKINPQRSESRVGLGNIAWLKGNLIDAKKQYELAFSTDPNNTVAQKNLISINNLLSKK